MRPHCLSSALLCFLTCSSSYLTKVRAFDGGTEVQLMSSITFLVFLLGRHGDRGGDLHGQRDQKRTEHVLCQEQGDYTKHSSQVRLVSLFINLPEIRIFACSQ